jgi:hypothetical protein
MITLPLWGITGYGSHQPCDQIGPHGIAEFLMKRAYLAPRRPSVEKLTPECTFSLTDREASGKDGPSPECYGTADTTAVSDQMYGICLGFLWGRPFALYTRRTCKGKPLQCSDKRA